MRYQILLTLIPISLAIASCRNEDLKLANSFGALSQDIDKANKQISADIYASCTRAATWKALGTSSSRETMEQRLAICDRLYRQNSEKTQIAGNVLVNYVQAVGNLATKKKKGFISEINEISDALGDLEINGIKINNDARTAGVKIADFITNLLLRDFRRRNLKLAIVCTDKDIQAYSTDLSRFIDSSYVDFLLNQEITQINEYFSVYIADIYPLLNQLTETSNVKDNIQDFSILQTRQAELELQARSEINKVIERKKQGSAYIAIIRKTADFHSQLKTIFNNNQNQLSSKQIKKCNKYRSQNENQTVQSNSQEDELWNEEINALELKKVKTATKEYIEDVTPLLKEIKK